MRKHTPGPWEADEEAGEVWAGSLEIAETMFGPVRANARLIAAAPDLLESAQRVRG